MSKKNTRIKPKYYVKYYKGFFIINQKRRLTLNVWRDVQQAFKVMDAYGTSN